MGLTNYFTLQQKIDIYEVQNLTIEYALDVNRFGLNGFLLCFISFSLVKIIILEGSVHEYYLQGHGG